MGIVAERVENMEKLRRRISNPEVKVSKTNIEASAYRNFNGILIEERLFKRCSLLKNEGVHGDVKGKRLLFVSRKVFSSSVD